MVVDTPEKPEAGFLLPLIGEGPTSVIKKQYREPASELVQPNAAALIESLRAFGYSPQAAIADLIDNSIGAGSRHVWIEFFWNGAASYILVKDDGHGMDAATLRD